MARSSDVGRTRWSDRANWWVCSKARMFFAVRAKRGDCMQRGYSHRGYIISDVSRSFRQPPTAPANEITSAMPALKKRFCVMVAVVCVAAPAAAQSPPSFDLTAVGTDPHWKIAGRTTSIVDVKGKHA